MRKYLQEFEKEVSDYLEMILSFILMLAMAFFAFALLQDMTGFMSSSIDDLELFDLVLARAMALAVGIELIKMISNPSPKTVIEVLLFALTRQLIVDHPNMLNFLFGIIAVAVLFAIRRYLFVKMDNATHMVVRGSYKLKMVNILARTHIQGEKEDTLASLIMRHLKADHKTVSVGSVVYLENLALRVDKMHGDVISRVEIIKYDY
ncbi:transporter associated domain-containing protein [Streptococcus pseudoporcinus]|uniref:Transporter associated domain protein n=1 Tax=Streptococcus pseudoporcinus LQ 940-04 TaxID=875093 RepID=G5KAL1_9STRE|nr:transporter associated domain-containing protein [Streptococcus pseudoporcinus]EFR44510.1 hypothetical protein HMPREF9320_0612 [Streptococcus pseudoporcinus SPIN 20026]EHI64364.1 transporter associated domain protein [Streptococcus pseudoporcinus LQ 940-04]VEF93093.1 membrane protein [Streptococcus pseudoporcinus]